MTTKEIVRLITSKSVLGGYPPAIEAGIKYLPLYRVYGVANGTKAVKGNFGDGEKLVGQFEATSLIDGNSVTGPMLILPPPMNETIAAAVNSKSPGSGGLSFAFEVGVKPATARPGKVGAAYEWVTKNLLETGDADPLAALRSSVLALPAPVTEGKAK